MPAFGAGLGTAVPDSFRVGSSAGFDVASAPPTGQASCS